MLRPVTEETAPRYGSWRKAAATLAADPILTVASSRTCHPLVRIVTRLHQWVRSHPAAPEYGRQQWSRPGLIAIYRSSITILRNPNPALGEQHVVRYDLTYGDIQRIEFVPPNLIVIGFGISTRRQLRQVGVELSSLNAEDQFDELVDVLESQEYDGVFAIRERGGLRYNRGWAIAERCDWILTRSAELEAVAVVDRRTWRLTTESKHFEIEPDQGLVAYRAGDTRPIAQVQFAQVLDAAGFPVATIDATSSDRLTMAFGAEHTITITRDRDILWDDFSVGTIAGDPALLRSGKFMVNPAEAIVDGSLTSPTAALRRATAHVTLTVSLPEFVVIATLLVFLGRGGEIH